MGGLTFRCPKTGKEIETGIEADGATRHRLDILFCRVPCPHCGFEHFPQVKRGAFEAVDFACEPAPEELTALVARIEG